MKNLIIFALLSLPALAQDKNPHHVCPALMPEANDILNNMAALSDQLGPEPECQSIAQNIASVGSVLSSDTWKNVKLAFKESSSPELEGEQIDEISSLVEKASADLTQAIQLVNGSSKCVPKKKKESFLATLSDVMKEVSTFSGSITGPYGVAVSMGSNALSSLFSGVSSLIQSNKVYDFKNPEEERLYLNHFCAYTELEKDIDDFTSLGKCEEELNDMDVYLDHKIDDLVKNCDLCDSYKMAFDAQFKMSRVLKNIKEDANIVEAGAGPLEVSTFSRCVEIARAIHSEGSDLQKLIELLEDYSNPLMSESDEWLLGEVVKSSKSLPTIFPDLAQCWSMPREEKYSISVNFNDFMRDDIMPLNETIFGQQMRFFQLEANKKYTVNNPLGDYIKNSLERKQWFKKEINRVQAKVLDPNFSYSSYKLIESKLELEDKIVRKHMPDYLKFIFKRNEKAIKKLEKIMSKFKEEAVGVVPDGMVPFTDFSDYLDSLKNDKYGAKIFLSRLGPIMDQANVTLMETASAKRLCNFLLFNRDFTKEVQSKCYSGVRATNAAYNKASSIQDLDAIEDFMLWADKNLDVRSNRVQDYTDRIRAWRARGDDRWETKN